MDEWIKPMRLTLLWFFMDELSHWHSLYFVFSWMKDKWWPPMIKAKAHVNHYRAHDNQLIPPFVQIL
jgi:hypothetical protein